MELENEAFYWAKIYDELTIVQYSDDGGGVFWMIGDESSRCPHPDIKIIAKVVPHPDSPR